MDDEALKMDHYERGYNLRRLDNRIRINIAGHMGMRDADRHYYVSLNILDGSRWEHVAGTTSVATSERESKRLTVEYYVGAEKMLDTHLPGWRDIIAGKRRELIAPIVTGREVGLHDISVERDRQETMKVEGRFKYTCADVEIGDMDCYCILGEEVGEVARAILERSDLANDKHHVNLRKELVQVAAVALAWVERLDKQANVR